MTILHISDTHGMHDLFPKERFEGIVDVKVMPMVLHPWTIIKVPERFGNKKVKITIEEL